MDTNKLYMRKRLTTGWKRYIKKNHIMLETLLPFYFLQGLIRCGNKPAAEKLLVVLFKQLKKSQNVPILLANFYKNISLPIETSPSRFGKKVKLIPRVSSFARRVRILPSFLFQDLHTRKFVGKAFITKLRREIYSGVFFARDSRVFRKNVYFFTSGFYNLRYINRRWY